MDDIVIVAANRTAVGRFGGSLRDVPVVELAALVIRDVIERAGLDPALIDEVIMGHTVVNGEAPAAARMAVLVAGLPEEIPARGVERQCASGLQAICDAAMQIQTGISRIVVAGGCESMSNIEFFLPAAARWGLRLGTVPLYDRWDRAGETCSTERFGHVPSMMATAANVAEKLQITRERQDEFALRSQMNAKAAMESGKFDREIVPVSVPQKKGPAVIFDRDEHPRPETTLEQLSKLKPLAGDTITAGNSSGMNDGAAACVVMSERTAWDLGLQPMGYLRGWAVAGVNPAYMGLGPVPAVRKLIERTGVSLADIDLIELNEAFAAQALGVLDELGIADYSNVNVNGSGIALGHPIGCTGARILATMLNEMERRGARDGLETMCIGGGQGMAALIERK